MEIASNEYRAEASKLAMIFAAKLGYLCGDAPEVEDNVEWYAELKSLMQHASSFSSPNAKHKL